MSLNFHIDPNLTRRDGSPMWSFGKLKDEVVAEYSPEQTAKMNAARAKQKAEGEFNEQ